MKRIFATKAAIVSVHSVNFENNIRWAALISVHSVNFDKNIRWVALASVYSEKYKNNIKQFTRCKVLSAILSRRDVIPVFQLNISYEDEAVDVASYGTRATRRRCRPSTNGAKSTGT